MDTDLSPEALISLLKTSSRPVVIDVRKRQAFEADSAMLAGAVWRDPHAVDHWSADLPPGCPVVVYCVHGHEVSRSVCQALRRRGLTAGMLQGGIEGWRAAGGPVIAVTEGAAS